MGAAAKPCRRKGVMRKGSVNKSPITLISKQQNAKEVGDFHPIRLVHSFAKLFSKILVTRLRRRLADLVSANQSVFIQGRSMHDNFLLVRQVARTINSRKQKGVFFKLYISRAFDSLSWPFLFELLRALGFGDIWLKWVALLLSTTSMKVLVNGIPGKSIRYVRGLRQGDPTSPQLFVLAIEVLSLLVIRAAEGGLLAGMSGCRRFQCISVYADDVALFIKPLVHDLVAVREILKVFSEVSRLRVNYSKSSTTIIRGDAHDNMTVKHVLGCELGHFPCKYLRLQPATRQLTKVEWQPMLDQVLNFFSCKAARVIAAVRRLILIKSVVTTRPVHHLLETEAPTWLLEEVNKWLRAFFWAGKEKVNGGQCMVAWNNICRPVEFGGLGVKDLEL